MAAADIVQKALKSINIDWLLKKAKTINLKDFQKVINNAGPIIEKAMNSDQFKNLISDLKLIIEMIKDYASGRYREIPFLSIAGFVFAALYILSPIDFIPDFLAVLGLVDDAAVLGLALKLFKEDLQNYKNWRGGNGLASISK